jgi:3-isopropylmalate dehydrogenase
MQMNASQRVENRPPKLLAYLTGNAIQAPLIASGERPLIGVLDGSGISPSVIGSALQVLSSVERVMGLKFEVERGGTIGDEAATRFGSWLPDDVAEFCAETFRRGGAILSGAGGGRYVYDLRRRFDLFCKFVPVQPQRELVVASHIAAQHLRGVDILIVRDNTGGIYQGKWGERATDEGRVAEHSFSYSEAEVHRVIEVAARAAQGRRNRLHVIIKDGGVPTVSTLWREVGVAAARKYGVDASFVNIDLAAYELIQNPARFDVIVAPNLFGDILADIAGVLVSSRGVTFSGNFNRFGHGVYQTNHGCAADLAGSDTANPAGQILSLAMLLRESFGLAAAATLIEDSIAAVWRDGWRTADLVEPGCRIVGTRAMTERIEQQILSWSPANVVA